MLASAHWRKLRDRPFAAPLQRVWTELSAPPTPPARVLRAIHDAESVSEILVGWVQLAGVGFFLLLYVISLPAFMSMGLQPVPIALALYGAFVAWRLNRAYANALTPRILSVSALVDVGVLMLLIWSFTLQYDQPAALYLKAPTLLYAFILIALRALRFDAGHVLLTGAAAIVGWLTLVFIAAREAPTGSCSPIRRDTIAVAPIPSPIAIV